MKNLFNSPFKGIVEDFKSRKACYNQDWSNALCSGPRYIRYVHDHFNNLNFFSFICFFLPPTNIGFDCFDIWMFMSGYWLQQLICSLLLLFLLSLLASNLAKKQVLTYFKEVFICVLRLYLSHTHTHTISRMILISLFRWKLEHRSHAGFYCYMWYHTLVVWWPAFVDLRSCRAHCNNV
jgi:hypothetical protein